MPSSLGLATVVVNATSRSLSEARQRPKEGHLERIEDESIDLLITRIVA